MTGYFINTNNYSPCEKCRQGFDKITMLCSDPYYKHEPAKYNHPKITGVTMP